SPVAQTSFFDQGYSDGFALVNGTTYFYYVSAINTSNLESIGNPQAGAIPKDFTPPGSPLGLKAIPACDLTNHVSLSWMLNVAADGATYTLYKKQEPSGSITSLSLGGASSYIDTNTLDNTDYSYWVKAIDANQNISEESLHIKVKT